MTVAHLALGADVGDRARNLSERGPDPDRMAAS
jgi:hypothetical protein